MTTISHLAGRMTATVLKRLGVFDFVGGFALESVIEPFGKAVANISDSLQGNPEFINVVSQALVKLSQGAGSAAHAAYAENAGHEGENGCDASCGEECREECREECDPGKVRGADCSPAQPSS